jgi:hypothetical protein
MKKFKLLLLDTNVVLQLLKSRQWAAVLARCEILLARTVLEEELVFYEDERGEKVYIDLQEDVTAGRVTVVEAAAARVAAFLALFKPLYLGDLDPGEAESLAYLVDAKEPHLICSADKIVFRVLGALGRAEQGLSLETVLQKVGLSTKLSREFSEEYRRQWTQKGEQEGFQGQALK